MKANVDSLVLATMNAPYSRKLNVAEVVQCLKKPSRTKGTAGPMSSFFYDVQLDLQRKFALSNDVSLSELAAAAAFFDAWSGNRWAGSNAARWRLSGISSLQ
jgi:hypothetical protein